MELTLASACWEKDYEVILGPPYGNKLFHNNSEITNRMLIINNVSDRRKIQNLLDSNKLVDSYVFAEVRIFRSMFFIECKAFQSIVKRSFV